MCIHIYTYTYISVALHTRIHQHTAYTSIVLRNWIHSALLAFLKNLLHTHFLFEYANFHWYNTNYNIILGHTVLECVRPASLGKPGRLCIHSCKCVHKMTRMWRTREYGSFFCSKKFCSSKASFSTRVVWLDPSVLACDSMCGSPQSRTSKLRKDRASSKATRLFLKK